MKKPFEFLKILSVKNPLKNPKGFHMIKDISIESTRKELSVNGGLLFFTNLVKRLELESHLEKILPCQKTLALIMGFIAGAECLDDHDDLSNESVFSHSIKPYASTTLGKFLRSLTPLKIHELCSLSTDLSFKLRKLLFPNEKKFILAMDSTAHEQTGQKMEGVTWNYKNLWCLDSLHAFDQFGFSYGFDLRSGNTYSGNGAELMIRDVFKRVPKGLEKYFRADSAYANLGVYNELLNANVKFTICLKANSWRPLLDKYSHNMKWERTSLKFFHSDECELSSCLYPLEGLAGRSFLRVVFIRSPNDETLFGKEYEYYAIVTNMGEHEMNNKKIFEFYRGRANAENFIKDLKMGMDFYHFPCQKLLANKMWGTAGIIAYNLMRYASFLICPETGCFIKKTRNRIIRMACVVVKHARKMTLRFSEADFREVKRLENILHSMFQMGFCRSWRFCAEILSSLTTKY